MRIISLGDCNIGIFDKATDYNATTKTDVVIVGYGEGLESDFDQQKALPGSGVAEAIRWSSVFACPVFAGVKTVYKGFKSISAAICNNGRLIDIVNRTINVRDDEYTNSDKIKIYKTEKCSAALLLDTDILLAKNWERVSSLADIIIGISLDISNEEAELVATLSQMFNKQYVVLATNRLEWKNI